MVPCMKGTNNTNHDQFIHLAATNYFCKHHDFDIVSILVTQWAILMISDTIKDCRYMVFVNLQSPGDNLKSSHSCKSNYISWTVTHKKLLIHHEFWFFQIQLRSVHMVCVHLQSPWYNLRTSHSHKSHCISQTVTHNNLLIHH